MWIKYQLSSLYIIAKLPANIFQVAKFCYWLFRSVAISRDYVAFSTTATISFYPLFKYINILAMYM